MMRLLLLSFIWLGLCGCAKQTHYYTLHHTKAAAAAEHYPFTLGLGPVFLPESHNQPGIVSLTPGNEVNVAQYHIWAGYLNQTVTRVLADDLSILLAADTIWPFPWDNRMRPVRQVRVMIEEMAGVRGQSVVLQAKYSVTADNGERMLAAKRTRIEIACPDTAFETYVNALNKALNQLSAEIAATLISKQ